MNDSEIIELYWQRKENAILQTSRKYGEYCRAIAEHILSNAQDAEECVSDTWLHAWNSIPPQRPDFFRAFLARITRNLAFSRWRSTGAQKRGGGTFSSVLDELSECIPDSETPENILQYKELVGILNRFLDELSARDRSIFLRRYFYAESAAAIAAQFGLRPENILVILSRTRRKFRQKLSQEGYSS